MTSQPGSSALQRISASGSRNSMAMRLLAGLAIGALLYFAHAVFIPIVCGLQAGSAASRVL